MIVPASRLLLAVPLLSSLLVACGGGSDSGVDAPAQASAPPPAAVSTPAVPTAPAIVPPAATVPPLNASITAHSPVTAVINRPTVFEVTGTGLDDTITIGLAGCTNLTQAPGGTVTRRVFTCTPSGEAGGHALTLSSSATTATSTVNQAVTYLTPVAKVGEINGELAVLKEDGSLWIWAHDPDNTKFPHVAIKRTLLGTNFTDLEAGSNFGLAINKEGKLWAWGVNTDGVYGIGAVPGSPTPVQVGENFMQVAAKGNNTVGGARVVGLKRDGTLWAWGSRSTVAPNSPDMQHFPQQFGTGFSALAMGDTGESMAVKPDGSLWRWNQNLSDTPFVISKFGDDYRSVATAYDSTYGIRKNGELWAWGRMAPQRVGAGGDDVPVLLGQNFVSVSAGMNYAVALKGDGTLWAYGFGAMDQFGNNAGGAGQAPVASEVRQAWARGTCTVVEKRDGTLWGTDYCMLGRVGQPGSSGLRQLPQY